MVLPIAFDGRQPRQGWGVCLFEGLALAASISLAGAMGPAPAAAAVLVTLDSGVWSVAAITASLSDPGFESLITLDHMPWLGQKSLAGQFAAAVGLALGQGNSYAGLPFGPVYLWKTDYLAGVAQSPGDWGSSVFNPHNTSSPPNLFTGAGPVISFDGPLDPEDLTLQARIAVATPYSPSTPAPSPLPLLGSLAAWQWSRRLRRRLAQRRD
jgi:hypothetical protein